MIVKLSPSQTIYLPLERLCKRSRYFHEMLQSSFPDASGRTISVCSKGDVMFCTRFLQWLVDEMLDITCIQMLGFELLYYCSYFQANAEVWEVVQNYLTLPPAYADLPPQDKVLWVREIVPFSAMRAIAEKVEDKIMRLVYIVTWFNEKAATTPEEREALECCKDYYLMSNLIGQTFPPQPTTTPKLVLAMLGDFPIAASCLKTMGSIDEMLVEQLQKQISH